jgi:hypothetical protein
MTSGQNGSHGQAYDHDMRVSIMLFVLLIAIALRIPNFCKTGDANANRQSYFSRAADLIVNLGLSIGASLLLSNRPRNDQSGADR